MSAPPSHIRRLQFRDYDPEQLRQVVDGGDMEHTILGPGSCTAMVQQLQTGRLTIDMGYYSFPFVARGQFPRNRICIGLAWGQRESAWANGIEVDHTTLVIHAEGNDLLYRAAADSGWIVVAVCRQALQEEAVRQVGRPLALPDQGSRHLRVPMPCARRLVDLVHAAGPRLETRPGDLPLAEQQLMAACVEAIGGGDPSLPGDLYRRIRERQRMVRRADAAMRRMLGGPYSSERLCRALAVTERTLQLHFKEALGVTPRAWFHRLALNRAHAELLYRPLQRCLVTEVALDCGFEHFGRFAQSYRELFGRAPSDTVHARWPRSERKGLDG